MRKTMNIELLQIGEQIRILRRCKGMGQEDLAEAAEVSNMTISRIENGTTAMSILTLKRIAEALDASTEEILMQKKKETQQIR